MWEIVSRSRNRMRFDTAPVYVVLLSGGLLVIGLVLNSVIGNSPTIWSMEDSYLYHTFGHHLAQGRFLTYSIAEPRANGNTSFLYYLVLGGIHTIATKVADNDLNAITLALGMTFGLHAVVYGISIALFARLLLHHGITPLLVVLICAATFFNGPMIYAFFSGLEPPLTVLLIIIFLAGAIINSGAVEFAALALMTLHRPESMLVAIAYAVLRYGWVAISKRSPVYFVPAILLMFSGSLVPILNFIFIGQFSTLSSARIGLHALEGDVSLLRDLLGRFARFSWLAYAKVVISAIVPWVFSTERSSLGLTSMQRLLLSSVWPIGMVVWSIGLIRPKSGFKRYSITAFIVLSLWVATVAILAGGEGEFARYLVVVFPLVAFLVASTFHRLLRGRIFPLILIILSLIPCFTSSVDVVDHFRRGTTFLHALHYQTALALRDNPDVKSVAFWETGILSLWLSDKKRVIDLYGLGTTRYANLPHGGGESKVLQFIQDKPDVLVQWAAWGDGKGPQQQFLKLLRQHSVSVQEVRTFSVDASLYLWRDPYPHQMSIYALSYP